MYPAAFEYHAPGSVEDAISLLGQYQEEAKLLAGGHSLIPLMKLRFAQPRHLIDIRKIPGLSGVRQTDGGVSIGALTTYRELEMSTLLRNHAPIFAEAAGRVGDPQVRSLGTIGGSLAHNDPAADLPAVVLALDCTLVAVGPSGERTIPAREFFLGLMSTALAPDEVLTEIRVSSLPARTGGAYEKHAHPASGYALCGVAAVITLDTGGKIERARVALTGIGTGVTRAEGVERALSADEGTPDGIRQAADHALEGLDLRPDPTDAPGYNAQIARAATRRALERAIRRARGEE